LFLPFLVCFFLSFYPVKCILFGIIYTYFLSVFSVLIVGSTSLRWYVLLLRCHRLCRMLDDPLTRHSRYLPGNHRTWVKSCTS
jgi:hypothetical protein